MITQPLYGNPLAGGALLGSQENQLQGDALVEQMQMRMQQRDQKTPAFMAYFKDVMDTKGYPTKTMEEYGGQFPSPLTERIVTQEDGIPFYNTLNVTPPSVPVSEQTPMSGLSQVFSDQELVETGQFLPDLLRNPIRPKSDDPIRQGFFDSEFYKPNAPTTMDVVNYTYQGKPMTGSSSNISQFQQYLDSIGKGDLIQRNDQIFSQETGPLQPADPYSVNYGGGDVGPNVGYEPVPYNLDAGPKAIRTVDPIVTGPQEIATQQAPNQFNDQFSGFDQRGLPSILGINPMGQQSSFEQTFNDKQGLDRYVDDLVNERLRDIFGGIMGAINV
tara:strand:- start:161 stop:1150 length:990 start_codon:yes stop_codon:yes gene_type:complete